MINEKKLKNELLSNGGLTLNNNLKKLNKKKGYLASYIDSELKFKLNEINELKKEIEKRAESLKKDEYIGMWVYENTIYLDTSVLFTDKCECLEFAKDNRQLVIFDIEKKDSIYLKEYTFNKIYTIYNRSDAVVAQFDTLDEVAEFLEITKKAVKNIICENKTTKKEGYKIIKDYVLI